MAGVVAGAAMVVGLKAGPYWQEVLRGRGKSRKGGPLAGGHPFRRANRWSPNNYIFTRKVSWQPLHCLPTPGKLAFSVSASLILPLVSATVLAKFAACSSKPALSSQIFG